MDNMQESARAAKARKADYRAATFRLPPDVLEKLDEYAFGNGMVKGEVVARALREYFERIDKRSEEDG